jgi:protein tyrosine phosphatase (PTP) superfamily phosphohydrolase (DUF442 family)
MGDYPRAYHTETGEELWKGHMPEAGCETRKESPMRRHASIALWLGLFAGLCLAPAGNFIEPSDVDKSVRLGDAPSVSHLRNMWISGQPSAADFLVAREEGITAVINLRPAHEIQWDEGAAVKQLGMTYYNLPVESDKPFSRGIFDMLDLLVAEKSEEQIWIHCSSANRVGAWLATHLVREKGMTVESSLLVARTVGMKKSLEPRVLEFLQTPSP